MSLLKIDQVTAGYGEVDILHDVSICLEEGEIVSLIGPNGAGKSTLMKTVFGLLHPRSGAITFQDQEITGWAPDQIVRLGMGYVPQTENIFPSLTVRENLEMGAIIQKDDPSPRIAEVFKLFPDLETFQSKKAGALSGGQRQMLAMSRGLMLDPQVLLLDEPSAGLAPKLVELIFERVLEINQSGVSILMVEQNAKHALDLSNRGYVLATGRNRFEGAGEDLLNDPEVARLYLGG
ncbi:MAG: ABC transporter ATP-binding protein [Candidatus Bipolaricaulia bacterium]